MLWLILSGTTTFLLITSDLQFIIFSFAGTTTSSFLLIQHSTLADSGHYACHPSIGNMAETRVHVIRSEWPVQTCVSHCMIRGWRCIKITLFIRWRPWEVGDKRRRPNYSRHFYTIFCSSSHLIYQTLFWGTLLINVHSKQNVLNRKIEFHSNLTLM